MAYIGKSPDGTGVRSRFYYTQISGGGTSVSGSDDNSNTLAFSDGEYVDVFLNGVLLVAGTDYNTNTANTISGLSALASGDVVEVVVYDIFTVADTVSSLNGGTFSGNVVFSGTTTGLDLNGTELVLDADADTSITADTDDQIDFKTGGSDRMHIMSDGNVGVGVSAITTGTLGLSNTFIEAAGPSGGSGTLVLSRDTSTDNDEVGGIRFVNRNNADDDGLDADGKLIGGINARVETSDSNAGDDSGGHLIFNTKPEAGSYAERVRITSGGLMCVARTSGGGRVNIQANTNNFFVELYNQSGSSVGSITTNGSSTAYNTTSDHRLKEAVVDMTGAIARVKQLAPKRFNFIADTDDMTVDGFLAHEAQTVVPEAVTGTHNEVDDDGNAVMQGIDQSKLVPLLTGALKEAIAKIETLEAKVAALEAAE